MSDVLLPLLPSTHATFSISQLPLFISCNNRSVTTSILGTCRFASRAVTIILNESGKLANRYLSNPQDPYHRQPVEYFCHLHMFLDKTTILQPQGVKFAQAIPPMILELISQLLPHSRLLQVSNQVGSMDDCQSPIPSGYVLCKLLSLSFIRGGFSTADNSPRVHKGHLTLHLPGWIV